MEKQTDIASISLAISNSVSKQVDQLETLAIQVSALIRPPGQRKSHKRN